MDVDTKDVEMKDDAAPDSKEINKSVKCNDDLTSGFAKHIEKEKVIEVFRTVAWPGLAAAGWTKVRNVIRTDSLARFSTVNRMKPKNVFNRLVYVSLVFLILIYILKHRNF